MVLSARKVETAGPGRYTDSDGLQLLVKPSGRRSWVFRYQLCGKRHDLGLGAFPAVGLADARKKAAAARKLLAEGKDPRPVAVRQRPTFEEIARETHKAKAAGWSSDRNAVGWLTSLEQHVFPKLGHLDVADVGTEQILAVLEPLWLTKTDTARRLRERMEAVLARATVSGLREGPNPALWRGHLALLLAKPSKVAPRKNRPAMDWRAVPALWRRLQGDSDPAARALAWTILTAVRPGEARSARMEELDLDAMVWTLPAEKMKARREHQVPLPPIARELIESRVAFGADMGWLFPSLRRRGVHVSDKPLIDILRLAGEPSATAHGFRTCFRTWAGEATGVAREVVEHALAHAVGDVTERAYARGTLLERRRALMEEWSQFLSSG